MNPGGDTPIARMVDVCFALRPLAGAALPADHHGALAQALASLVPWLAQDETPAVGVHRLKLADGTPPLLSPRTRLVLRVARERAAQALALKGAELAIGSARLRVGTGQLRELLPWGTLYAHCVAAAPGMDEAGFLHEVERGLQAIDAPGRAICGRAQVFEHGALHGWSLMVDGLSAAQSVRLLDDGLGAHRRLGCGVFVPHKSAAAVGTPP